MDCSNRNDLPKISIIIPVYNTEKYLEQCLDSVCNQTYKNLEIVCVNDGSTDKSGIILDKYKNADSRIKVITQANAGVSKARNAGLSAITGDYLMFVDSDDWVDLDICNELMTASLKNNADCCMCTYIREFSKFSSPCHIFEGDVVYSKDEVIENIYRRIIGPIGDELAYPDKLDSLVTPCMQLFKIGICNNIKFEDIEEIGSFEDGLFQLDVYKECKKYVYIDKPLYHYRKTNSESIVNNYRQNLFDKWNKLYNIIEDKIKADSNKERYLIALNNRISIGLLGLGLNETFSGESLLKKASRMKTILKSLRYKVALRKLNISYMPFYWKIFFLLCKAKMAVLLVLMLHVIEFLRVRVKR